MGRLTGAVLVLAATLLPATLAGQSLDDVDRLVRSGRVQEAREALLSWSESNPSADRESRQRALWFRGVLNLDPGQAAIAFRRLAVEYPGGAFTDLALQRLAMAAALRGDLRAAEESFSLLARDYPGSPLRPSAVAWLARNRSALDALRGREDAEAAVPERPAAEQPGPPPSRDRAEQTRGEFAAQLGAFSSREGAEALAAEAREAGFRPRIVRVVGVDFFRVRIGRFEQIEEARGLVARLRSAGLDATLATDADRERAAG